MDMASQKSRKSTTNATNMRICTYFLMEFCLFSGSNNDVSGEHLNESFSQKENSRKSIRQTNFVPKRMEFLTSPEQSSEEDNHVSFNLRRKASPLREHQTTQAKPTTKELKDFYSQLNTYREEDFLIVSFTVFRVIIMKNRIICNFFFFGFREILSMESHSSRTTL